MPFSGIACRIAAAPQFRQNPIVGGPYNALSPLVTPTPDGSGYGTHVDVVDMGVGVTWNGWRYWMAFTPFANSVNSLENPCILVSSDGINWQVPTGLTNPIDPFPGGSALNSDPDLMLGPDNVLYCYYRSTNETPGVDGIKVRSSSDGVTWSAETQLFTDSSNYELSPTVIYIGGGTYWMFLTEYVTNSPSSFIKMIRRTASSPLGPWSAPADCTYTASAARSPWHIDISKVGTKYVMLVNENQDTSGRTLALASSTDGLAWTVAGSSFMVPSNGATAWDKGTLYRGCMEPHENGTDLRVWYSGNRTGGDWRIGYTTVPRALIP